MSDWQQVGENLVRHRGGTIYVRAKVMGKVKRVSLQTDDLRIAKIKRDAMLETLRTGADAEKLTGPVRTIGNLLTVVETKIVTQPHLKEKTADYYREMFGILRKTMPLSMLVRSWTAEQASAWWKDRAKHYSPQRANNILGIAKRVGKAMVEMGLRTDDPTSRLKRKKMEAKHLSIPSRAAVDAIIADIRGQKKAHSEEASNFVAFLAYSGCRVGQARAFEWKHVEKDWLLFPAGIVGAKGAATRRLPVSMPLKAVIDQMSPTDSKGKLEGPLFTMQRPHEALKNACKRLKMTHLRIHDLRHFFASFALESGVDVPTVALWLGHKDGGVLVLRTYGHVRNDHSLSSAAKLK